VGVPGWQVDQGKLGERVWKKDCHVRGLDREDAMDRGGWMRQMGDD